MMPRWGCLLLFIVVCFLPLASPSPINDFVHGVYYVPSYIGLNPHSSHGQSDLYSSFMTPIHERDLPLMGQIGNYIRLTGSATRYLTNDFLDLCTKNNLKVIVTWSFMEYNVRTLGVRELKRQIKSDFEEFVVAHKDHPAIAIWTFGDVFDPLFSQDDQSAFPPNDEFVSSMIDLLVDLYNTLNKYPHGPVCVNMFANLLDSAAMEVAAGTMTTLGLRIPFECWILGFTTEELLNKDRNTTGFGLTPKFLAAVNSGHTRQVLAQFATSAYDAATFRRVTTHQDYLLAAAVRLFRNPLPPGATMINVSGIIVQEWSDQWWRGDTMVACDSGRQQPYFQSRCLRGFQGLTQQYDQLGSHCIRLRPAVLTFGRAKGRDWNFIRSAAFFNESDLVHSPGSLGGPFNGLSPDQSFCTMVFPAVFQLKQGLAIGWAAVLLTLTAIAIALSMYWRNHNYRSKKIGREHMQNLNNYLDWDELGNPLPKKVEAKAAEAAIPALLTTKVVPLNMAHDDLNSQERKQEVAADEKKHERSDSGWYVRLQSRKHLPGTKAVASNGSDNAVFNEHLDLYLREQLKRQKYNVDRMIEHESTVLQVLADHCLVTFPDEASVRRTAVANVHARMLEGYHVWLTKRGLDFEEEQSDVTKETFRKYAHLLCFRLMVSLAEHIAHCPERLAQVYHEVLHLKFEGAEADASKSVLVIDLNELQRGLDGDDEEPSIMKGTINFDDINDCGILQPFEKPLRKTWHESPGPAVVFDYMRDYDVIAFFKMWLFCVSTILSARANEDWIMDILYPFCQLEAGLLIGSEVIQFFYQLLFQNRSLPRDRIPGLIASIISAGFMLAVVPIISDETTLLFFCLGYAGARIVRILGMPMKCRKKIMCFWRDPYPTAMPGRLERDNHGVAPDVAGVNMIERRSSSISEPSNELTDNSDVKGTEMQAFMFWVVSFGLTLVAEVFMIVPIATRLTFEQICYDPAMERCLYEDSVLASLFGSNICGACHVAIVMAKLLMAVTVFSDTPLIFYISVAAWGYIKGQKRKVANVFSMDACKVDLRDNGQERGCIEAVFGKWANSQEIWKAMINDLYVRDLICESDCRKLSTTGKKCEFSQLNPEPRERLSFWLQTVKAIAKSTKADRRDHLSSFFPLKTSKLKREQLFMGPDSKVSEDAHRSRNHMFNAWISRRQQRVSMPIYKGPTYYPKGTKFPVDPLRPALVMDGENNGSTPSLLGLDDDEEGKKSSWCCGGASEKAKKKRVRAATKAAYDMTNDETADRDLRSIPRLSHIITCYNETVMLSMDYLRDRNGDLTNLEHMIHLSTYSSEWNHAQDRFRKAWDEETKFDMLQAFLELPLDEESYTDMEKAMVYEVRLWASMRAQTLIRTIRGALSYHDALRQRFSCFQRSDGSPCDLGEGPNLGNFVELIIAHQTYGDYPRANNAAAAVDRWLASRMDIDGMMERFKDYPIFLVYDYKSTPSMKERDPTGKIDFDGYWLKRCEPFWLQDEQELAQYWADRYGADQKVPPFANATMIKAMVGDELKLVSVLPRMFPLRIGPREALTQGKAANQINALRCVSGHVIQVSDANMDGWIGEGFKLPHITRTFQDGTPSSRKVGSRTSVRYRIIGFREYIYTGPLGSVATAMASSEFTFGTLFQRVLSNPLNVRMHYGHPDFFDAFWVLNRGTLSKASPNLNLSEDVFSGYNTLLRDEKITHSDQLEWQKGREVVFTASSGFMGKITAGSVAIQRSRDMKYMQFRLDFPKKLSLYFGGIGSYVLNLLIDYSISLYTLFFTLAAYSTVTLADIQATDSVLGAEWLIGLGLVTSLGYLTEMMLEYGWGDGLLKVMRSLPATALFYLFQNKGMANAMIESVRTGNASYFDSGRPNAFDHYTLRTMYHFYAESHYYPALFLFSLFYFYNYFVGLTGGALPMFLVASACISWIVAPVMFCPQISNINILKHDTVELMHFIFSVKGKVDDKTREESLDRYWRDKDKSFHQVDRKLTRLTWWVGLLVPTAVVWLIAFSIFIDHAVIFVWVWLTHAVSTIIFFYSNYTNLIRGIWYFIPLLGALLVFLFAPGPAIMSTEVLVGAILFVTALRVVHWGLLLILSTYVSCRMPTYKKKKGKPLGDGGYIALTSEEIEDDAKRKKDVEKRKKELQDFHAKWVENFYYVFLDYHVHLYCGIAVGLAQVVAQLVFMLLSWVVRWLLRFYSSQQIRSAADFNLSRDCVRVTA